MAVDHSLVVAVSMQAVAAATPGECEEIIMRCQTMAVAARLSRRRDHERTARKILKAAEARLEELRAKA